MKNMIDNGEIQDWNVLTKHNKLKCWKIVKKKIKQRIILSQERNWVKSKVGKVLKQYKGCWWVDRIINDITDPTVNVIRRMRIGNSDLNTHKTGHGRNRLCRNCDGGIPETLDHFFLGCKKYSKV